MLPRVDASLWLSQPSQARLLWGNQRARTELARHLGNQLPVPTDEFCCSEPWGHESPALASMKPARADESSQSHELNDAPFKFATREQEYSKSTALNGHSERYAADTSGLAYLVGIGALPILFREIHQEENRFRWLPRIPAVEPIGTRFDQRA